MDKGLSVVIITRNRPHLIRECVRQVLAQDYPREIIVVDASDGNATAEKLRDFAEVRYIYLPNAAHQIPRSRNVGISSSHGDIVAFIDDDSIVQPGWARHIVDDYDSPEVGGVGGLVLAPGETPVLNGIVPTVTGTGSVRGNFNLETDHPIEVGHLRGCNMSFRRSVLEQIGGFDTRLDISNFRDETDVCVAVNKEYKLLYDSRAAVVHIYEPKDDLERDDWKDSLHRFSISKNTTYFRLKHFMSGRTLFAVFVSSPLLTLVSEIQSHGIKGLNAVWSDWKGRIEGALTLARSHER